ncbi:MAG: hypothetical protein HRT77_07715 [Halioglobus sp.]|nr:hypothetical protein [Halioglobus sp.]
MKLYLAACSLSLLSGVALGYLNGKQRAALTFVDQCTLRNFVVIQDRQQDALRRYHCFELTELDIITVPATRTPPAPPFI